MKNKPIVLILIILGIILIVSVGVYFIQKNKESVGFSTGATSTTQGIIEEENQEVTKKPQSKIITDDFSIDLPEGWQQIDAVVGTTAMAVNMNENISDPAVQKINFRSYFAVAYETFEEGSIKEYTEVIKQALEQSIGSVVFTLEEDTTINGQPANQIEAEMTQQGVDFKVLLVIVKGHGDDIWTISFNTTESNWKEYKQIFYNTAKSFVAKK
jgi:hypothetical protein